MTGHLSDEEYDEIQRAKTVNKYETGDPGSDEDEHLESIENRETDQFGFYRNPRFLKFETQKLKSKSRQTKRREKKWEKMAKDFPKAMNKKLKSRTYKGTDSLSSTETIPSGPWIPYSGNHFFFRNSKSMEICFLVLYSRSSRNENNL